ncbi:MAG: coagulation factor 5/8 type domain-containing protein [Ktedonobacteraceae bacterium]|nr:coagulation factor 5/8 type domain-containing protein [Ktedonobacteraceae bacterium]
MKFARWFLFPLAASLLVLAGILGVLTQGRLQTYAAPAASTPVVQINAGGPAVSPFSADTDFSGGGTASSGNTISTTGVSNPAPMAVYQTNRVAPSFSYTIPNLSAGASYTVRLHFAETYWTQAGKRVFNVSINNQPALTNFDIFAAAGGVNQAVVEPFNITASTGGSITIQFTSVTDQAQVNGIEVLSGSSPTPTTTPPTTGGLQINAGGPAAAPFVADTDFSGGATAATGNAIDTSGVSNPAPQAVYQSNRYGNFTYTIPNLTPGASYTVQLDFAETYWTQAGQRTFNVNINGQAVLSAFDIIGAAGAPNKAVARQFSATATSSGAITIQFVTVKDNAQVNGVEVLGGTTITPTPITPTPITPTPTQPPGSPNFGPNVIIFDPSMSSATIQSTLDSLYKQQETNQFGTNRYALFFKPGTYSVSVNLGFYMQALGLGFLPDAVNINGSVSVNAGWMQGNATQNFWRGAENMRVSPASGNDMWAVAQAAPLRRMDMRGNVQLWDGGWSSGGFLADSVVSGQVQSGSQQQWLSRNDQLGSWAGGVWNMVFVGVNGAPAASFPNPPETVVNQTPVVREKPFLYIDQAGNYQVFVPALRTNSQGTSWANGSPTGTSLSINQFYIAHQGDSAATINNALAQGLNLIFTPGVYALNDTIRVTRANTVVLGLGLATLSPQNGVSAMSVADVDGASIAGLLFDAGPVNSPILLQIGPNGSSQNHAANPTVLSDVFFRIGGAGVGKATQTLVVNSNNVILDHLWLWRADHGSGIGWTTNTAANGLVVNGTNVTAYGLFVEHYQQYEVIWNGNGGRTYFFQNEMPYDPPNQAAWMNGSTNGYAAYKVADSVTSHEAWGLGSYCLFNVNNAVVADRAFEVPNTPGVRFHDLVTVSLGGVGTITHIINNTGGPSNSTTTNAYLVSYP